MLLLGVLSFASILLVADANLATRISLLHFWSLFAAGVFAVMAPHVLLPDPHVSVLQLFNPQPRALLHHQLRMWKPVVIVFALPCILLAFYAPGDLGSNLGMKSLHGLASLLVVPGIGLYSYERYATIGAVSQDWQEGRRGQLWRAAQKHGPLGFSFGVPDGLVPAVTATGKIFSVGVLAVVTGLLIPEVVMWLPGFVLLAWSASRLLRRISIFDRHFYRTNALYSEIFRSAGGVHASQAVPIPYEALYWVPERWRPHVWISLRQLDRRLPLGRFIALGHALLWLLFYQDAGGGTVAAYLLIFSVAKNGVVVLLGTEALAPQPFQLIRQSPANWIMTRFFVNLRWTLPLLLSLLVVALLDDTFSYVSALAWTGLDIILALFSAGLVTYFTEIRYSITKE